MRGVPLLFLFAASAFGQALPAAAQWSGQVQCQLNVKDATYAHQETQTWTLTGQPPAQQGAIQVYPATWVVSGQGSTQRATGAQTLAATWKSAGAPVSAPIGIFVRASDNRLVIKSQHAQLVVTGGVSGTRQTSAPGAAPAQGSVQLNINEWPLPPIEDAANSVSVSGSGTVSIAGSQMPMQQASATATASCSWDFHKGAAAPTLTTGAATRAPAIKASGSLPSTARVDVSPSTAAQATSMAQLTLTGFNTHWDGTVFVDFGAGIRILHVSAVSATTAKVYVGIDPTAALGPRTVTVGNRQGAQYVDPLTTSINITGVPATRDLTINPNIVPQGQGALLNFAVPVGATGLPGDQLRIDASCGSNMNCVVVSASLPSPASATANVSLSASAPPTAALGTHTLIVSSVDQTTIEQTSVHLPVYHFGNIVVAASAPGGAPAQSSSACGAQNVPIQLNQVRGDTGSDVDNYSGAWQAVDESDCFRFHVERTVASLTAPPLRALITISGLQSDADFDLRLWNPGATAPYSTVTHTGASSATACVSNGNLTNGPDVVVELHARKPGPYTVTVAGNSGTDCVQIPTTH